MKRIMTFTGWLVMAATLIAGMTACTKENNTIDEPSTTDTPKTYTMTVTASKSTDDATTRALSLDGKTLNAIWDADEYVAIYAKDYMNNYQLAGTLSPATTGSATATLTGSVTLNGKPELTLVYVGDQTPTSSMVFSYMLQDGLLYSISRLFDYASATVAAEDYTISGTKVSTVSAVNFVNEQAIVRFHLKRESGGDLNASSLTVNPAASSFDASGQLGSVPGVLTINHYNGASGDYFTALRDVTNKTLSLTATVGSDTYIYKRDNVTFVHGQYYEISVKMKKLERKELSAVTASEIGWVVGSDGKAYKDKMMLPSGVTARAVIGYHDNGNKKGYAFALEDVKDWQDNNTFTWANASTAITVWGASKTISGHTWKLLEIDQWQVFLSNGGNDLIRNAGGTELSRIPYYWTSTEDSEDTSKAKVVDLWGYSHSKAKTEDCKVRAGIEFTTDN